MANDLESKLGAILSNPEMMGKIQAMAQSLGQDAPVGADPSPTDERNLGMLKKLGSLAGQTSIDSNQQTLLLAMTPYLSTAKIQKLEKAMRAAKMARLASGFLNSGGLQMLAGR